MNLQKINYQKELEKLLTRLEKEEKHFQLLVIGDWSFCEEANQLKKKAGERIHFLGTQTNVQDYLYCADAFCLSSVYEGLPISLLEALSCGCVPVCTPVGGIKDVVQNEVTGFLSDSVSEDDYYRAVNRFMESKDKIKEYLAKRKNEKSENEIVEIEPLQLIENTEVAEENTEA